MKSIENNYNITTKMLYYYQKLKLKINCTTHNIKRDKL